MSRRRTFVVCTPVTLLSSLPPLAWLTLVALVRSRTRVTIHRGQVAMQIALMSFAADNHPTGISPPFPFFLLFLHLLLHLRPFFALRVGLSN